MSDLAAIGTDLDVETLIPLVRALIERRVAGEPVPSKDLVIDHAPFPCLNVTLRNNGLIRGSMSGNGLSLGEQLYDATLKAAQDVRFSGPIVSIDLKTLAIEVWLQVSSEELTLEDRLGANPIDFGSEGVEVRLGAAKAYYKPSVALTKHFRSGRDLFSSLCKKAGVAADAWTSPACCLFKTRWVHLCEAPNGKINRLHALRLPKSPDITPSYLQAWGSDCVSYFVQNQQVDGDYTYQYLPFSNSAKKGDSSPVRTSGCAYAIAVAASSPLLSLPNEAIRSALCSSAGVLRRSDRLMGGGRYIRDSVKRPGGKLGTTALCLLALLTPELRGKYQEEIGELLISLKSAQSKDGLLSCTFMQEPQTDSQINFFPGQALLALVISAEGGDDSCRETYRRAFEPYRDHFRRSPATAFVGWHADVWTRAALLDGNSEYADFVFEQIDWLLQFQLGSETGCLNEGGFSRNGKIPNYSSIVYTEAIARAVDLAYKLGDPRWERYRDSFHAGLRFCSQLRLTEAQSIFFPDPKRAIGGMAASISDFTVRADVVQHAITLILATLERPILCAT